MFLCLIHVLLRALVYDLFYELNYFERFFAAMVFVNHYLAFDYFASVWYPFSEVMFISLHCIYLIQGVSKVCASSLDGKISHVLELGLCCVA